MMNIDYVLLSHGLNVAPNLTLLPDPITELTTSNIGNGTITLTWVNPLSTSFIGVRIQRKVGSYPISPTDGTTVVNGVVNTFTDTNLTNGTTYYYRAFTYDKNNTFNQHESQQVSGTPYKIEVYTVEIDLANSDPNQSVKYLDDAVGKLAGSYEWDNIYPFNSIKPVMLKNGNVNYYLNPNDFTKKLDGSTADITSGNDGDVMIQFPKVWTFVRKVGNKVLVSLSAHKINSNYKCLGHTKSGVEKDYFYVGAYQCFNSTDLKMRSLSGKRTVDNLSLAEYRNRANSNGNGYRLFSYYQFLVIQILYLIKYKNLNSQAVLGTGSVHRWSEYNEITGFNNKAGMTKIDLVNPTQMKLFGIEDLWAGFAEMIDGIIVDRTNNLFLSDDNFNDAGTGYSNFGKFSTTFDGSTNNIFGENENAFIPIEANGSETTYFCDVGYLSTGNFTKVCLIGGMGEYYFGAGIFSFEFSENKSTGVYCITSRLAYL